jgi:hypothetical protein
MTQDILNQVGDFLDNALAPGSNPERITFRRFPGDAIKEAAEDNREIPTDSIDTVTLRVNPEAVSFSKRKVIQKVQTSAPGRFIVFDWGSELTVMGIEGNTGNLLPDAITKGTNPLAETLLGAANEAARLGSNIIPGISAVDAKNSVASVGGAMSRGFALNQIEGAMQDVLIANSTYFELLELSPKFKTFKRLEKMFDLTDVDRDVLTLEFGSSNVYRGFFEDFSFSIEATMPWNWKYNIAFVILNDLNATTTRWDSQYSSSNTSIKSAAESESL